MDITVKTLQQKVFKIQAELTDTVSLLLALYIVYCILYIYTVLGVRFKE